MPRFLPIALIVLFQAQAAAADEATFVASLELDLNRDGQDEYIELSGIEALFLEIRAGTAGALLASGAEVGHLNGQSGVPRLDVNAAGSLMVTSEHLNGPSKYAATLVVAYRDQAYRIVGVTFDEWGLAFADPETGEIAGQSCDMNLLTGKGVSTYPDAQTPVPRRITFDAPRLEEWRYEMLYDICGVGAD